MKKANYIKMDPEIVKKLQKDFPNWKGCVTSPVNADSKLDNYISLTYAMSTDTIPEYVANLNQVLNSNYSQNQVYHRIRILGIKKSKEALSYVNSIGSQKAKQLRDSAQAKQSTLQAQQVVTVSKEPKKKSLFRRIINAIGSVLADA